MDPVMIRPPGIDNGFVSPESVWYARVLLLFSASAMTDTGSKSFECGSVPLYQSWNHMMILKMVIIDIIDIITIITIIYSMWNYNTYAYYSFYCNYC